MTLAYIQSSRGLEVASKSFVLILGSVSRFQSWSLRKGCVGCHASGYKRSLYHVFNCCSYALVILAYFQSSRGLEVASKSSVLSVAYHKFQSWSLQKGLFCLACHASAYKRNLCHVLNCCSYVATVPQLKPKLDHAETKKSFHEFSFTDKAGAALV